MLKYKIGDLVKVVNNNSFGYKEGTIGVILDLCDTKDAENEHYHIKSGQSKTFEIGYFHEENDLELL